MREHGHLTEWNDQRGFGFITPASGHDKVFVHVSAFPRGGGGPIVGEILSFERGKGRDGRLAALHVQRAGGPKRVGTPARTRVPDRRPGRQRRWGTVLWAVILLAAGAFGFQWLRDSGRPAQSPDAEAASAATVPQRVRPSATPRFNCDGRTHCSEMTSCAEARSFLRHCPGVQMDGDADGIPCESQWCN